KNSLSLMDKFHALVKEKIQQNFGEANNHSCADARPTQEVQGASISTTTEVEVLATSEQNVLVTSEQNCILIPSYACRTENEQGKELWKVRVRGWAYISKTQSRKQKLMMGVARRVAGVNNDEEKSKTLEDRVSMFLAKNLRNQDYIVQIDGLAHPSHMELDRDPDVNGITPPTDESYSTKITSGTGHFSGEIEILVETVDQWIANAKEDNPARWLKLSAFPVSTFPVSERDIYADKFHGFANLIGVHGISIISDIDDTIKHTDITSGPRAALSSTFLYDQQEVSGMANVYQEWNFPPGSAHLKLYDLKNLMDSGSSKRQYIRNIIKDFPQRKFILIGDSGESDMEIYSDMAEEFPEQILYVFIRDVSTERIKMRPPPPRRSKSFPFVPRRSPLPSKSVKTMPVVSDTIVDNFDGNSGNRTPPSPSESEESSPTTPLTPPTPTTPSIDPLQEFNDRVEKCRQKIPNRAFALFKESQDLIDNEVIKNKFLELRK
ncbi:4488_t:CDS:2, partial [Racocetra persica]